MPILKYPLATEKSVGLVDKNNTIIYVVDYNANKKQITQEFEKMFNVKVESVKTTNLPTNAKKAFIKLAKGYKASEVAVKLKLV